MRSWYIDFSEKPDSGLIKESLCQSQDLSRHRALLEGRLSAVQAPCVSPKGHSRLLKRNGTVISSAMARQVSYCGREGKSQWRTGLNSECSQRSQCSQSICSWRWGGGICSRVGDWVHTTLPKKNLIRCQGRGESCETGSAAFSL